MTTHQKQQTQPEHHADKSGDAQLCVIQVDECRHRTSQRCGIEKGHNAFNNQVQSQARKQIRPVHISFLLVAQRAADLLKYLKNSLSGDSTNTSSGLPKDARYACKLR